MRSSHVLDRLDVTFDDEHAVAHAGLVLTGTLAAHLGIEAIPTRRSISVVGRERPGRGARS